MTAAAGIGAVVLAAGKGRRIGTAKLRLLAGGETFLHRCDRLARSGGANPVLCVVSTKEAAWAAAEVPGARVVVNGDDEADMLSSVQVGLGAIGACAGVVILPVDHPFVNGETIRLLIAAAQDDVGSVFKPAFNGRSGHPVLVPQAMFPAILGADRGATLREILRASGFVLRHVAVDDASVLRNINTAGDLISE
jgi:CTP:molybdopterin cytidylyltransferase MocA